MVDLIEILIRKVLAKMRLANSSVHLLSQRRAATAMSRHLVDIGWVLSHKTKRPVTADGNPIPWYTYPAISFLLKSLPKDITVFEYGSGNSTLWWAKRAKHVTAYEHDKEWHDLIVKQLPENVGLNYLQLEYGGNYCKAVTLGNVQYDVVVIDGRDRVNCAYNVLKALTKEGIIIWDNADREAYNDGYDFLIKNGFRRVDFIGYGPVNSSEWNTSIFYRDNNCLGL